MCPVVPLTNYWSWSEPILRNKGLHFDIKPDQGHSFQCLAHKHHPNTCHCIKCHCDTRARAHTYTHTHTQHNIRGNCQDLDFIMICRCKMQHIFLSSGLNFLSCGKITWCEPLYLILFVTINVWFCRAEKSHSVDGTYFHYRQEMFFKNVDHNQHFQWSLES